MLLGRREDTTAESCPCIAGRLGWESDAVLGRAGVALSGLCGCDGAGGAASVPFMAPGEGACKASGLTWGYSLAVLILRCELR